MYNPISKVLALLFVSYFGVISSALASSVSLSPSSQTVALGSVFSLEIDIDFTDEATIGGGIDVLFGNFTNGNEITFLSFTPANLGDPGFRRTPDVRSNELNGIAFGEFNGITGPASVGVLTFQANQAGSFEFNLAANDFPAGAFVSAVTNRPFAPDFTGARINVSSVPVPAALWLMLSGVGAISGINLRKRKAN